MLMNTKNCKLFEITMCKAKQSNAVLSFGPAVGEYVKIASSTQAFSNTLKIKISYVLCAGIILQ